MKNGYRIIGVLSLVIGVMISCEKSSDSPENTDSQDLPVIAGVYNTSDYYYNLSPYMQVVEKETGCLLYTGKDSLDIDNNNVFELILNSWSQVPDIAGECCDCPDDPDVICDCIPTGRIFKYFQIQDTSFQIACDINSRAVCFSLNDTIENWPNWVNTGMITLIDTYNFPPPVISYGNWISDNDMYLGIRKVHGDTTYGWLRLNLSETIEVKELYLEK